MIASTSLIGLGFGKHVCPACAGGPSKLRSLSVWMGERGELAAYCHRASCGEWGNTHYVGSGYVGITAPEPSAEVLRPYTGDRFPLLPQNKTHLQSLFGFIPAVQSVRYTTDRLDTPYIVPILAPSGSERGVTEATYGPNKRRRIWKAKDEPMISWTPGGDYYDGVYLVEDQISALKLHHIASIRAVALLGTSLNAQSVAEIQRNARHVTIALDMDATSKAFLLARKWGSAFKSCNVQILTQDIKDMSFKDIRGLMKDAGHIPVSSGGEF